MDNRDTLVISQSDYDRLTSLVKVTASEVAQPLETELDRASVVPDEALPHDVVAMNSRVTFRDLDTDKNLTVTLVFPTDADVKNNKISILSPVGSALIGLKVGQAIGWPVPKGKERNLEVVTVEAGIDRA